MCEFTGVHFRATHLEERNLHVFVVGDDEPVFPDGKQNTDEHRSKLAGDKWQANCMEVWYKHPTTHTQKQQQQKKPQVYSAQKPSAPTVIHVIIWSLSTENKMLEPPLVWPPSPLWADTPSARGPPRRQCGGKKKQTPVVALFWNVRRRQYQRLFLKRTEVLWRSRKSFGHLERKANDRICHKNK